MAFIGWPIFSTALKIRLPDRVRQASLISVVSSEYSLKSTCKMSHIVVYYKCDVKGELFPYENIQE
jgi:hypothetical protein